MRATIVCQDGQPSQLHVSKNGTTVELTPGEARLAARLLQELRDKRSAQEEKNDRAHA